MWELIMMISDPAWWPQQTAKQFLQLTLASIQLFEGTVCSKMFKYCIALMLSSTFKWFMYILFTFPLKWSKRVELKKISLNFQRVIDRVICTQRQCHNKKCTCISHWHICVVKNSISISETVDAKCLFQFAQTQDFTQEDNRTYGGGQDLACKLNLCN